MQVFGRLLASSRPQMWKPSIVTERSVSRAEGIERGNNGVVNASNQEKQRQASGAVDHLSATPSAPHDFERFRCRRGFSAYYRQPQLILLTQTFSKLERNSCQYF
jgi:hypothetical protein